METTRSESEQESLEFLSRIISKGVSSKFLFELNKVIMNGRMYVRDDAIGNSIGISTLPDEILSMIFNYTATFKLVLRGVCFRWRSIICKYRYNREDILRYNSEKIMDYICKGISRRKLEKIKMCPDLISKDIENSVLWLLKHDYMSIIAYSYSSSYPGYFDLSIKHDCMDLAQYIFNKFKDTYVCGITIYKNHLIDAANNGNYKLFIWLDKMSYYIYHNTQILNSSLISNQKLREYAVKFKIARDLFQN